MKIIDLNVLLYVVNKDSAHHAVVLSWWNRTVNSDEPVGLPWIVLLGFIRIATNPDIFARPLDVDTAISKIDEWLSWPNTRLLSEKEEHWTILRSLQAEAGTAANLVTDTHLAALTISSGAILVSCDNDFARFRGLRWENPLREA